jgi:hypothetical protein
LLPPPALLSVLVLPQAVLVVPGYADLLLLLLLPMVAPPDGQHSAPGALPLSFPLAGQSDGGDMSRRWQGWPLLTLKVGVPWDDVVGQPRCDPLVDALLYFNQLSHRRFEVLPEDRSPVPQVH